MPRIESNKKAGLRRPPSSWVLFTSWLQRVGVKTNHKRRINGKTHCSDRSSALALWKSRPDLQERFAGQARKEAEQNAGARKAYALGSKVTRTCPVEPKLPAPAAKNDTEAQPDSVLHNGLPMTLFRILGQGTYATVWKATLAATGVEFATKLYRSKNNDDAASQLLIEAGTELHFFQSLHGSPHVLQCFGTVQHGQQCGLLLELAASSLAECIRGGECLLSKQQMVTQILLGLLHLASRSVVHGDLKPSNILQMKGGHLAISDLGLARRLCRGFATVRGHQVYSLPYRNPECLAAGKREVAISDAADIWALGVITFEICVREPLWASVNFEDWNGKELRAVHSEMQAYMMARKPAAFGASHAWADPLMRDCFQLQQWRPSAKRLLHEIGKKF